MNELFFNKSLLQGNAKRQTLDGSDYLVLPVIGMREGVMNGMFYSSEEIQANVETWAGVPIPIGHPMKDGKHVSANDPDIEANQNIGTVYNPRFDDGELKAEFWINIEKTKTLGHEDLITRLESGETVGVSTGLRNKPIEQAGIFGNSSYTKVAHDIRPDHLAILPNEIGACSVADGCGTGAFVANADDSGYKPKPCCGSCSDGKPCAGDKTPTVFQKALETVKSLFTNEQNHSQIRSQLHAALNSDDTKKYSYVMDVYDSYVVYERGENLYQQNYSLSGDAVELAGTENKVIVKHEYVLATNTKENKMKAKLITEIVANTASKFGESDKETLEALEVNVLEGIHGSLPAPKVEKEVSANSSDTITLTPAQFVEYQGFVANSAKIKEALVAKVKEGYGLEDEQLNALDVNSLETLAAKLSDKKDDATDYSGQAGSTEIDANSDDGAGWASSSVTLKD